MEEFAGNTSQEIELKVQIIVHPVLTHLAVALGHKRLIRRTEGLIHALHDVVLEERVLDDAVVHLRLRKLGCVHTAVAVVHGKEGLRLMALKKRKKERKSK